MKTLSCLFWFSLLWGCSSPRYVYTPSAVNNPFLTQKGDGEINALYSTSVAEGESGSTGSSINGIDLMGSYAILNNFGIQGHYFYRGEKDAYSLSWPNSELDATIKYNRNEFQFGLGGFVPLDKRKSVIFSAWAGAGFGGTGMSESGIPIPGGNNLKTGNFDYKTTRLYFQPSLNFIVSEHFKTGIVAKFNTIRFSNVTTDFNQLELVDRVLDNLEDNKISVFEAGYNMSFGFRGMKHVLFTHQLTFAGGSDYYDMRPLNFSIGLSYVFKPHSNNLKAKSD
jgi:hypothetical protein